MTEAAVRLRVRTDLTDTEICQLPEGTRPGHIITISIPGALAKLHLASGFATSSPASESVLRRHFTAMLARIAGLDTGTPEQWQDTFSATLDAGQLNAEAVQAYTSRFTFDLADPENPYLQNPALSAECSKASSVARLHALRPSGNNVMLWDHTPEDQPMLPLDAYEGILMWLGYGECGLGSSRTYADITSKTMKAAPYRATVSYFPETGNLFTSLLLSCPPPAVWPESDHPDLALWEAPPSNPLCPPEPSGPISLLAGRSSHHVLAEFDAHGNATRSWVTWGIESGVQAPPARDPFVLDREKGGALRGDHRRALLRDFDALLDAANTQERATAPAWMTAYTQLPEAVREELGPVRIRTIGFEQDMRPMGDSIAYTATTPEPVGSYLSGGNPDKARIVHAARKACVDSEYALIQKLGSLHREVAPGSKSNPWTATAKTLFWGQADQFFWRILREGADPAERIASLALDVYDEVTSDISGTAEGFLVTAKQRSRLGYDLRKITD